MLAPLTYHPPTLGYDWLRCFREPGNHCGQVPWVAGTTEFLAQGDWRSEMAVLNGLTIVTVAVATAREVGSTRDRLLAAGMAILSPPVILLVWVGQIDALGVLGLLLMPWGIPLLLMKPQVLGWAMISRRRWMLITCVFLAASLLIWGWWPPGVVSPLGPSRTESPIDMGWAKAGWHILVLGLIMLMFTNRDPHRLLAVGAFLAPYLQPYHLAVLLPALGRARGWHRWLLWAAAWITGLATAIWVYYFLTVPNFNIWAWSGGHEPIIMPIALHLALILPLLTWWCLRRDQTSQTKHHASATTAMRQGVK